MKGTGQLNTFSESSAFIFKGFTVLTALLIEKIRGKEHGDITDLSANNSSSSLYKLQLFRTQVLRRQP